MKALYFRGMAFEGLKQFEKAEADLLQAHKLEPKDPKVKALLATVSKQADRRDGAGPEEPKKKSSELQSLLANSVASGEKATELHLAAGSGDLKAVLSLIQGGADIEAKGLDGATPLHLAVIFDRAEVAVALVRGGANVHAPHPLAAHEGTSLHHAAANNRLEMVRTLVKGCGAQVDFRDQSGSTALHKALIKNNFAVVKVLVKELGADVDAVMKYGWTGLHLMVLARSVEGVKMLVEECKADVEKRTNLGSKEGTTPLQMARQCKFDEVAALLLHLGAVDS